MPQAHALSPRCTQILALPSVSAHYVQRVIDRANQALLSADALPVNEDFGQYLPDWAQSIFSSAVTLIDTTQRLTQNTLSLEDHTSCLTFDAALLECQIEKTFESLNASLLKGSWVAILQKQSLLFFLHERLHVLQAGAFDATYVDPTWNESRFFDPVGPQQQSLCPYHTDYLPPARGYGCDVSRLLPRRAYPPAESELQGLLALSAEIEAARPLATELLRTEREITSFVTGNPPEPLPPPAPQNHLIGFDCAQPPGFCSLERTRRCSSAVDCGTESLGVCILEPGFCEGNVLRACSTPADCAADELGTCLIADRPEPLHTVLGGPFAARENTLALLRRFLDLKMKQGESRSFASALAIATELPPGSPAELSDHFGDATKASWRLLTRTWSRLQGALEANIFPRAADVPLELFAASPLRAPMAALAHITNDRDGLPLFVKNMALWERIQCMFRPCRAKLEHALKINDADACFPYASGAFIDDTEAHPRWVQCAQDACLRIAGVPLPATCEGVP